MGQNCIGIERFLVPEDACDALTELMRLRIAVLRCGSTLDETRFGRGTGRDSVDCGAMISDARFDELEALIDDAVAHGAKLVLGGRRVRHARWPRGHYFAPTLLTHVTRSMRIANEELFAPVFLVMPYKDEADAVSIANGTPFGLGASVFGRDATQCRRVAAALTCGMVNINECVAATRGLRQLWHFVLASGPALWRARALGLGPLWRSRGPLGHHGSESNHRGRVFRHRADQHTGRCRLPAGQHAAQLGMYVCGPSHTDAVLQSLVRLAFGSFTESVEGLWGVVRSS